MIQDLTNAFQKMLFLFLIILCSMIIVKGESMKSYDDKTKKTATSNAPYIGAQVFIEPGQTQEEIDHWFQMLKENNFTTCRIRMFELYMRNSEGTYDFTLFDHAFKSAENCGIKVYATIFPYTEKTDIGGFKFPRDNAHQQSIATFISQLVPHYTKFKSLYGWVLINEPGIGGNLPQTSFTQKKFEEWKLKNPQPEYTDKGYPVLVSLTDQRFLLDYNTWYLQWLADEVRKYDNEHEIHVNNHAIFQNCAEYNFPEWRNFLTSLGGSAHPAWHFSYFTRQQYAVAMSANAEIIRSGAGDLPWIMTELQGGNNIYTTFNPMCPTKEEIAQWLWIIAATEGKGTIFWCLNPRTSGIEAGEWALLDYQNKPSDRMEEASRIAKIMDDHKGLFSTVQTVETGIHILYVRQSMWAGKKMSELSPDDFEARKQGGVIKSALAYFEALGEMGINAGISEIGEFPFGKDDYSGTTIILAHQVSMPDRYAPLLEDFVQKGGKLIVDGLTAFFDENLHNTMSTGFTYEKLFGGNISEFKFVDNLFQFELKEEILPAHLWRGYIYPVTGQTEAEFEGEPTAIRNRLGKGEVLWIPSPVGLGSRLSEDYAPLSQLLNRELSHNLQITPVRFKSLQKGLIMKSMHSGSSLLSIIINKNEEAKDAELIFTEDIKSGTVLYQNKTGILTDRKVKILSEETIVIEWK